MDGVASWWTRSGEGEGMILTLTRIWPWKDQPVGANSHAAWSEQAFMSPDLPYAARQLTQPVSRELQFAYRP